MTAARPPFNWAEYLRLATELSQTQDEASQRSSISRAYYSVYHAATIHAQRKGYTGRSHHELWAYYQGDPDRNCRKLSQLGNSMKVARKNADYVTVIPDIPDTMAQQLEYARRVLAILSTLAAGNQPALP